MMFRALFWLIIISLVLSFLGLLYLKNTLPPEDSSVFLKDQPNTPITGYVTRKDKYVVVLKEGSEQVYPWDEVKRIYGPKPPASKSRFFYAIAENLDFLSGLGVLSALIVFSFGLYQYRQGLLWKREEFLSDVIKRFGESPYVGNARKMLESLRQYRRVKINLDPEKKDSKEVPITNKDIIKSLAKHSPDEGDLTKGVRLSFDTFLDYFETLDGHIQSRVVAKKSVHVRIGYWLDLLGRHDKLNENSRRQVINYAEAFDYTGAIRLIHRYNKFHRLQWRLKNWRAKVNDNPPPPEGLGNETILSSDDAERAATQAGETRAKGKLLGSLIVGLFALKELRAIWGKPKKK